MPAPRLTKFQKRKREDEDYNESHVEDGDAGTSIRASVLSTRSFSMNADFSLVLPGRPAVKSRSDSSKARPITIKKRHENNQQLIMKKYSKKKLPELRKLLKPFGIPGAAGMRKDELLQLCLLYDSELSGE